MKKKILIVIVTIFVLTVTGFLLYTQTDIFKDKYHIYYDKIELKNKVAQAIGNEELCLEVEYVMMLTIDNFNNRNKNNEIVFNEYASPCTERLYEVSQKLPDHKKKLILKVIMNILQPVVTNGELKMKALVNPSTGEFVDPFTDEQIETVRKEIINSLNDSFMVYGSK